MENYTSTSYDLAEKLTLAYSTSFGSASKLYAPTLRPHIFAIYAWVRIADEIVDTYHNDQAAELLDDFYASTIVALNSGFSTNPIIHAFADTARIYAITQELMEPFLSSMREDLDSEIIYTQERYDTYIHGSAEVVGLMCLRVFLNDSKQYEELRPGAVSLGAAFQKVNFLRDFAHDTKVLKRYYFPNVDTAKLTEKQKLAITDDILRDFKLAETAIQRLPTSARYAVLTAFDYYGELLQKLIRTPAAIISNSRVSVPRQRKALIFFKNYVKYILHGGNSV